jgi:hypothetical protein
MAHVTLTAEKVTVLRSLQFYELKTYNEYNYHNHTVLVTIRRRYLGMDIPGP